VYPYRDFPVPEGVVLVDCPTPMYFVAGTEDFCNKEQEQSPPDELEGIVDPNLMKREEPKVKVLPEGKP
ncbi:MAG: hypothetical protein D6699_03500, partial [Aquificota bacterium]